MKLTLITALCSLLISFSSFSNTGGPDAYGYTWIDSNEPGGPTYNWIDITGTGTLVSGLTDDNSVPFINMGLHFHYYWGDYAEIKIGSNGWLSFENTSNIAHCFPTIPSPGGAANTYLAPFMSDLSFSGAGNTGQVYYYYDAILDQLIISYINVPWWSPNPPDYVGSNTFQVILSNADSSITYQYQTSDIGSFTDNVGCASDIVIVIEAPTGSMGLSVFQDLMPTSNYAIKFIHPNPVLIQIPDIEPFWSINPENGGEFRFVGESIQIPVNIKSVGSDDIGTAITVDVVIQDQVSATVATYQQTISSGLLAGQDSTLYFLWVPSTQGQFSVTATTTNADDINNTNDVLTTEYEILDANPVQLRLSYVNVPDAQMGSIAWNSGNNDGVGTYFIPNSYPFDLDSIGAYVLGTGDVVLSVYLDDAANNMPGTLIHTETIPNESVTLNTWIYSSLATTYSIVSDGFYVVWTQPNGSNTSIGTVLNPPFSRRNVEEILGFVEYRDNETQEFMLAAYGKAVCASLLASYTVTDPTCNGGVDGSIDLSVTGGTPAVSGYTYSWVNYTGVDQDPTGIGAGQYIVTITDSVGCTRDETIVLNEPTAINLSATSTDEILANDGAIDLTVSGGTAPYTFSWTGAAGTTEDPSNLAGGTYTVTVTDNNGCIETLDVTVNSQLGLINDVENLNWSIYPVPSSGLITIQFNSEIEGTIEINNALGQIVYSGAVKVSQELTLFEPGIYTAVVKTSEGNLIKRIVIR